MQNQPWRVPFQLKHYRLIIPEQEDQASVTMDIFPEMEMQKGEGNINPIE